MKLTSKDRKALEHGLRGIDRIDTDLFYGNICVAVEQIVDRHVAAAIARAELAEAKVARVEVVLREITDAGQDALVGGFPEVRARIRAALTTGERVVLPGGGLVKPRWIAPPLDGSADPDDENLIEFVRTFETGEAAADALPIFLRAADRNGCDRWDRVVLHDGGLGAMVDAEIEAGDLQ